MSTLEGPEVRDGILVDEWFSLYNDSWKCLISEASFAHPAKMALGLLRRIFAHAKAEGWLAPKTVVLDPFMGIGTTALEALLNGCAFMGVELEARFFSFAQTNIAQWIHDYRHLPTFGPWAMCVNGDSRKLLEHIPAQTDLSMSSPPFATSQLEDGRQRNPFHKSFVNHPNASRSNPRHPGETLGLKEYAPQTTPGNLANMPTLSVSSPPYANAGKPDARGLHFDDQRAPDGRSRREASIAQKQAHGVPDSYGETPGQLGAMPIDMAVASPPYGDQQVGKGADGRTGWRGYTDHGGGTSAMDGQMAAMPVDMSVSSPPWENVVSGHDPHIDVTTKDFPTRKNAGDVYRTYGDTTGQLGQEEATTFWEAARQVVSQTYALLRPGAHAIWVCKRYVRDGKIVNFSQQWADLCVSCGFELVHWHKAMLIEEYGEQETLFGETESITVQKKSFFRRLYEKRPGAQKIDWEDVLCMVKPSGEGSGADLCASSPPYNLPMSQDHNGSKGGTRGTTPSEKGAFVQYGTTPGQLEGMPMGDAVISSPPYSVGLGKEHTYADPAKREKDSHRRIMRDKHIADPFYGTTEGQLGSLPEDKPTRLLRPRKPRVAQERVPTPEDTHG